MVPSPAPRPALGTRAHASTLCVALLGAACMTACITACAGSTRYATHATADGVVAARPSDMRTLDAPKLHAMPHDFLLDAINAYWPSVRNPGWATTSRLVDPQEPVGVYENELYVGGLDMLRDVRIDEVERVRRLTPAEESLRFGRMHRAGALVVEWVRAPRAGRR